MSASKIITVFGASGQQGGAVARALLSKGFTVRAVTRDPSNEKVSALKAAGAEIVKGDLGDRSSIEAAVAGAYGVFLVTDYFSLLHRLHSDKLAQEEEIAQGKAAADASLRAGVKHLVFSSLPLSKGVAGITHPVGHFDGKALIAKYLDEIGVPNTSVRYAAYYENFTTGMRGQPQPDGSFALTASMDGPMYTVSVEDSGAIVASIFAQPKEFIGQKVALASDRKTFAEYAAVISKVTGKNYKYNQVPLEVFASFPFPGADDCAYMFDYFKKATPYTENDVAFTKKLNPHVRSFEEWAEQNKDKF